MYSNSATLAILGIIVVAVVYGLCGTVVGRCSLFQLIRANKLRQYLENHILNVGLWVDNSSIEQGIKSGFPEQGVNIILIAPPDFGILLGHKLWDKPLLVKEHKELSIFHLIVLCKKTGRTLEIRFIDPDDPGKMRRKKVKSVLEDRYNQQGRDRQVAEMVSGALGAIIRRLEALAAKRLKQGIVEIRAGATQ
jgi:hypothetical protein